MIKYNASQRRVDMFDISSKSAATGEKRSDMWRKQEAEVFETGKRKRPGR